MKGGCVRSGGDNKREKEVGGRGGGGGGGGCLCSHFPVMETVVLKTSQESSTEENYLSTSNVKMGVRVTAVNKMIHCQPSRERKRDAT
jgi:hypothetical protein